MEKESIGYYQAGKIVQNSVVKQHRIWFILLTHGASHIIMELLNPITVVTPLLNYK